MYTSKYKSKSCIFTFQNFGLYLYLYLYLIDCICICICIWYFGRGRICICIWNFPDRRICICICIWSNVFDPSPGGGHSLYWKWPIFYPSRHLTGLCLARKRWSLAILKLTDILFMYGPCWLVLDKEAVVTRYTETDQYHLHVWSRLRTPICVIRGSCVTNHIRWL